MKKKKIIWGKITDNKGKGRGAGLTPCSDAVQDRATKGRLGKGRGQKCAQWPLEDATD